MEKDNEKVQKRRTILLSVAGAAVLTASIIFFILGSIKFARAKSTTTILYVDPPYDPKGEEAEENAKIDLVQSQKMFEGMNQYVQRTNLTTGVHEDSYMGEGLFAYEYRYVNDLGEQVYRECIWAENDDYVRRFVGSRYVGYTFYGVGKAYEYVESKQHLLKLDAYELDFDSCSGTSSFFTTADPKINELYASFTHQEYDPSHNQILYIGLYPDLKQVMITPDKDSSDVDFLLFSPRDVDDYGDMPCESAYRDHRYDTTPNYTYYANVDYALLPAVDPDFQKYYVQPKGGAYGEENGMNPDILNDQYKNEFYIGFVDAGDKKATYGTYLIEAAYAYDSVNDEYTKSYEGYLGEQHGTYTVHVKLSYKTAEEVPAFEAGLLIVDHSRTFIPD